MQQINSRKKQRLEQNFKLIESMLRKEIQKTRIRTKQQQWEQQQGGRGSNSISKREEAIPW